MGGHISVESKLGEGSTFVFELPLPVPSATDTVELSTSTSHRLRVPFRAAWDQLPAAASPLVRSILIVHPNAHAVAGLQSYLQYVVPTAPHVDAARSAADALGAMQRHASDVAIVSRAVDGDSMGGLQLCRRLRALRPELQTVLLRSLFVRDTVDVRAEYGVCAVLADPARASALRNVLAELYAPPSEPAAVPIGAVMEPPSPPLRLLWWPRTIL